MVVLAHKVKCSYKVKSNSYILRKQCSLLSHEGWALWWDTCVRPTPHVRGGSIAPEAPKFFPKVKCSYLITIYI